MEMNEHERDAMAVFSWAKLEDAAGTLEGRLRLEEIVVGCDTRIVWSEQVQEEGWILGAGPGHTG